MKLENFILHIVNPDPRAVKNDARLKKFLESRKMIEKWGLGDAAFQEPIDADLIRLFLRYLSAAPDVEVHPERRSKDGVVLLEALKGRGCGFPSCDRAQKAINYFHYRVLPNPPPAPCTPPPAPCRLPI